jgi:superfamily I DNA and/or RNA helicase
MLNTSYRLNEPICNFIAESFYGGKENVISANSSRHRRLRLPEGIVSLTSSAVQNALQCEDSLIWIRSEDNGSQQLNLDEAEAVSKLVSAAIKSGLPSDQQAIVTPYRRQAAAIRRLIQYEIGSSVTVPIVDTVERVQGLTVELVAISICTTDPEYASETATFIFSPNRLNVAVSRARTKVVIFASESIFDALPTEYDGLVALKTFQKALLSIAS